MHVDIAGLPRCRRPGHRVTGDRPKTGFETRYGLGVVYLNCVVDDRSRYADVEQYQRKTELSPPPCCKGDRALRAAGLSPLAAVLTDNAYVYTKGRAFKALLVKAGARHITCPPYTPRSNRKVERFIRTLKTERADAHAWPNSTEQSRALASFVRYRCRPHSPLQDRPPTSVLNACGQDN